LVPEVITVVIVTGSVVAKLSITVTVLSPIIVDRNLDLPEVMVLVIVTRSDDVVGDVVGAFTKTMTISSEPVIVLVKPDEPEVVVFVTVILAGVVVGTSSTTVIVPSIPVMVVVKPIEPEVIVVVTVEGTGVVAIS